MDQRRFDDLARNLGATNSRRNVLKGLLAGAVTGVVGAVSGGSALAAKGGNGKDKKPDCCPNSAPRLCSNVCVDFDSDPNNCGGCGNVCEANAACVSGTCQCPDSLTTCGGSCVDTSTDPDNCGACGNQCGSGETCNSGTCQTIDCNDDNDCTIDAFNPATQQCEYTNALNGTACSSGGSSGQCVDGTCVTNAACLPGASQSCSTGLLGICASGTQTCTAEGSWGPCVSVTGPQTETCNGLDDDCDGVVDNGFDLTTDVNNCGTCGHQCTVANGTPGCDNGTCTVVACNAGFADCDGNPSNGCETNTSNDSNNCGACGNKCSTGQTCVSGTCTSV